MNYLAYSVFFFILGLLFYIRSLWKNAFLESYRQKLFKIRDQFFVDALENNLDFNSEAYGFIRTLLNGHIRYAEHMSLWRMIEFSLFVRLVGSDNFFGKHNDDIISNLNIIKVNVTKSQGEIIESAFTTLEEESLTYIMITSPVLSIFLAIFFSFIAIVTRVSNITSSGAIGVSSGKMYLKDSFEQSFAPNAYQCGKLA